MEKFDKKKHDECFFYFKKELIRNGAYFDFIDELCRFDDFNEFVKLNKDSNLFYIEDIHFFHHIEDDIINVAAKEICVCYTEMIHLIL